MGLSWIPIHEFTVNPRILDVFTNLQSYDSKQARTNLSWIPIHEFMMNSQNYDEFKNLQSYDSKLALVALSGIPPILDLTLRYKFLLQIQLWEIKNWRDLNRTGYEVEFPGCRRSVRDFRAVA